MILSQRTWLVCWFLFISFNCFLKNVDSCVCNVISMWEACASCAVVWNGISDEITSVPTFF